MQKLEKGIVVATRGRSFIVRGSNGDRLSCEVRKKIKFEVQATTPVAVGDDVLFSRDGMSGGAIEKVLDRRTSFVRPMVGIKKEQKQVLAANLDCLAIITSVKSPPLKTGLIDRYLIAAQVGNMKPLIVFNKMDLKPPDNFDRITTAYRSINIDIFPTSVINGDGIKQLSMFLILHRTLFSGHSGVGKSTLLNTLIPELNLKTDKLSAYSNRGKHVTTSIELYELPDGGLVADSPGLKVMGLWDVDKDDLPYYYPEFRNYEKDCRFQPCTHIHEPDCAVKKAVENNQISGFRYQNYIAIADSLENRHN